MTNTKTKTTDLIAEYPPPYPLDLMYETPAEERDLLIASLDTGTLLYALFSLWVGLSNGKLTYEQALLLTYPIQGELARRIPRPEVGSARLPRLPEVGLKHRERYDCEQQSPTFSMDAVQAQRLMEARIAKYGTIPSREPDPEVVVLNLDDVLGQALRGRGGISAAQIARGGLRRPSARNRGRS
jgi:hypothetical protein